MITPPNPLARLVGELPKLRERLAKATPGPWEVDDPNSTFVAARGADRSYEYICRAEPSDFSNSDRTNEENEANAALIAASPSAHAIAIEAIERLERVEKALLPFARAAKYAEGPDNMRLFGRADFAGHDWREVTLGDLRNARAALAASKGEPQERATSPRK